VNFRTDPPQTPIPREKIFAEKVSSRVRVRPKFEAALEAARQIKAHAPHCRKIPTGKRKGRNPSLASIYRALTQHEKRQAHPEAVERAHADFATLQPSTRRD
jgi:hypothetical protein